MSGENVSIVDRLTDAFFAVDDDWRFTYCNGAAARLLDRSREDLYGRVLWDVFPTTDAGEASLPDGFYRAMERQVPETFEWYVDHEGTWYEARAYPSEDGLSVLLRDVTAGKRRETERAQHAAVVEAMQDGVVTLDDENRIVSLNPSMERILGVDAESLRGDHVHEVVRRASIDDADAIQIGRAINDVDVGNAENRTVEVAYTADDGERGIAEVRMVPIDDDTASIAAIVRDVSDQRAYEETVTSLHEITRWLLESTDPAEICAIAVHAGSDLLDLPISGIWLLDEEQGRLDPVAGTAGAHEEFGGLPRFYAGDDLAWDVYESGEPRLIGADASEGGLFGEDTAVRSELLAPIGTHGIMMAGSLESQRFDDPDLELISTLTENTRAALDRADRERVLRDRTEQLERQTERLQAVATVLSEDLKTELADVAAALDEDDPHADEWEFPLADDPVGATLDRAERLVDDVREFARNAVSVGPRSQIQLGAAVEAAASDSRLGPSSIVVDAEATLRADPDRFRYMLESIFDDAVARSRGDDVTVQIEVLGRHGGRKRPRGFYVLDDAAEKPDPVTEDGVDPAAPDSIDGFGLAVARTIAEAHGWSVSVSTGDLGGTRFEVQDVTTLETR